MASQWSEDQREDLMNDVGEVLYRQGFSDLSDADVALVSATVDAFTMIYPPPS